MSIQGLDRSLFPPTTVELALLGFVRHAPSYGYEIYHQLNHTPELRLIWRMKQSRLYALLARLEDAGLLQATLEQQDGRPPRKVFHLTADGAAAFREWVEQPVAQPREMRLAFMLKLYFAMRENPDTVARLVEHQRTICAGWLADESRAPSAAAAPYLRAVAHYRHSHIEAISAWLATLLDDLADDGPGDSTP